MQFLSGTLEFVVLFVSCLAVSSGIGSYQSGNSLETICSIQNANDNFSGSFHLLSEENFPDTRWLFVVSVTQEVANL